MSGPSSSQEIELELTTWPVPDSPPAAVLRRVQEGIHQEINDAFAAAPHLGAETGGILLGRRDGDRVVIDDFEPVPCEHRFGPSYRLSNTDREMLLETLEWFRSGTETGLSVLGLYRSYTVGEPAISAEDEDLMRTHFAEGENLVLLIKPSLMGSNPDDFFLCRYQPATRGEATNGVTIEPPQPAPVSDTTSRNGSPVPVRWPPPRPRLAAEPERPARRWRVWYIAAAVLGLVGGALGYVWLHVPSSPARPLVALKPPASPLLAPAASAPALVEGTPDTGPDLAGVHALLDRWASALKQGDVETAAECYAPVVTTYYAHHDVSRAAVRQSLQQARARYGRLEVYRISGLGITPISDTRAVATFRKHWRTAGRRGSSGEEEERMTLVRNQGVWQISSEQTQR